jgi:hypothetical protein
MAATRNVPGHKRRRVCHYLRADLAERLAVWADGESVSVSRIIEDLIAQKLEIEDPGGTCYQSEVPAPPPPPKNARPLAILDHEPFVPERFPKPIFQRVWAKPAPNRDGFNDFGRLPI